MNIVTVIPLTKGVWNGDLTYFSSKEAPIGSIVVAPVRGKKILGLVISTKEVVKEKGDIKEMSFKLRKIDEVKEKSIFKEEFLKSVFLFSKYFNTTPNKAISQLIPAIFKNKYDELAKHCAHEEPLVKVISGSMPSEKLLFQTPLEERISFYKTLVRGYFASKKSVFVVLPTENDIDIFKDELGKGIEQFTFTMHSGMKTKEIINNFSKIMSSSHSVLILGTTPYLSIPRDDIGTIIVEHESTKAYRSIAKPYFDYRTFAEIYASSIGAKLVLADTLLRFETIARKDLDSLSQLYPLSFRTNNQDIKVSINDPNPKEPEEIYDMNGKTYKKEFRIFSEKTLEKIESCLKSKKKIAIFSLRKGLATFTICRDCNTTLNCDKCLAPVVLYESKNGKRMFMCNKCGTEKKPDTTCVHCGSWNLTPLGIGTDTVYEQLKKHFGRIKIYRIDKDSVKTSVGAKKVVKEFEEKGGILLGTEMMFFYLRNKFDLSIIASFDSLWSIPNYKMSEKILHILLNMISLSKKEFIIQTKNINDPALVALESGNLFSFVKNEIKDRKDLEYPPYKRFIKISVHGDKNIVRESKGNLETIFKDYELDIFSGFISKSKNKYVTNALIRVDPKEWNLPEISLNTKIDKKLEKTLKELPADFEVFVDPEDLL